jgi:hypothetical protein
MTYDDMLEVIKAAKEGKTIQYKKQDNWESLRKGYANFNFHYHEYRVKPEPKVIYVNENNNGEWLAYDREASAKYCADRSTMREAVKYIEVIDECICN